MSCKRRILFLNLTLVVFGVGATVGCRAEGVAAPRAASGSYHATLLPCAVALSPCDSTVLTSQTTTHSAGRWNGIAVRTSQLASGARDANAGWQTAERSVSGRNANFSLASAGMETDGRLALNVTLDSYYHGAIFNNQTPFEPMQVSLNYIRVW